MTNQVAFYLKRTDYHFDYSINERQRQEDCSTLLRIVTIKNWGIENWFIDFVIVEIINYNYDKVETVTGTYWLSSEGRIIRPRVNRMKNINLRVVENFKMEIKETYSVYIKNDYIWRVKVKEVVRVIIRVSFLILGVTCFNKTIKKTYNIENRDYFREINFKVLVV